MCYRNYIVALPIVGNSQPNVHITTHFAATNIVVTEALTFHLAPLPEHCTAMYQQFLRVQQIPASEILCGHDVKGGGGGRREGDRGRGRVQYLIPQ